MSDDVDQPVSADALRIGISYAGSEVTIVVDGDLDLSGIELFVARCSEALRFCPALIVLDARGLVFIDSAGLMAMWRAGDAAEAAGVAFRVSKATPAVRRVVELLGLHELLSRE